MRVSLSQYLPQTVTVVFRVDARDAGQQSDVTRARVFDGAMWYDRRNSTVGTDGLAATTAGISVQIPAPCGWMPYEEYVAAGMPDGCWTCRPGDTVVKGEVAGALADAALRGWGTASIKGVRDLAREDGFRFRGRRGGAMRYARVVAIEAV